MMIYLQLGCLHQKDHIVFSSKLHPTYIFNDVDHLTIIGCESIGVVFSMLWWIKYHWHFLFQAITTTFVCPYIIDHIYLSVNNYVSLQHFTFLISCFAVTSPMLCILVEGLLCVLLSSPPGFTKSCGAWPGCIAEKTQFDSIVQLIAVSTCSDKYIISSVNLSHDFSTRYCFTNTFSLFQTIIPSSYWSRVNWICIGCCI